MMNTKLTKVRMMNDIDGELLLDQVREEINRYNAQGVDKEDMVVMMSGRQFYAIRDYMGVNFDVENEANKSISGVRVVQSDRSNYIEPTVLPKNAIKDALELWLE